MYTFAPIPPIDTINDHNGFVIVSVIAALIFIAIWLGNREYRELDMYRVFVLFSIFIGLSASISWNTGTYKEYANIPVTGTFVKFEAEGFRERSGKSYVDRHYTYVVYSVDGQNILLPAAAGFTYPTKAVLYKN